MSLRPNKRIQALLQQAGAAYLAEIASVQEEQKQASIGAGHHVAINGLSTMEGAAVIGIYDGQGKGISIVVQSPGLAIIRDRLAKLTATKGGS